MAIIYEIRASLYGSSPTIQRVVHVPASFTLRLLHEIFQAAFAWENFHRHFFKSPKGKHFVNEDVLTLKDVFSEETQITYVYDLGNSWTLLVELLREWQDDEVNKYPICVEGKRKAPPEDSGGIVGYQMALEMLSKPDTKNALMLNDWYGENFNPDDFNMDEANQRLDSLRF
jgi:hypothetical protein